MPASPLGGRRSGASPQPSASGTEPKGGTPRGALRGPLGQHRAEERHVELQPPALRRQQRLPRVLGPAQPRVRLPQRLELQPYRMGAVGNAPGAGPLPRLAWRFLFGRKSVASAMPRSANTKLVKNALPPESNVLERCLSTQTNLHPFDFQLAPTCPNRPCTALKNGA